MVEVITYVNGTIKFKCRDCGKVKYSNEPTTTQVFNYTNNWCIVCGGNVANPIEDICERCAKEGY